MVFGKAALPALSLLLSAVAVHAEEPAKTLRIIGEAPTASDPVPKRFVAELTEAQGDSSAQTTLTGWLASIEAPASSGEVTGACVEQHCTFTADLDGTRLEITGDFAVHGLVSARFAVKDDDKTTQQGAVSLAPLGDTVPGLGVLAPANALNAGQLDQLLTWARQNVASGWGDPDDAPDGFARESLGSWQNDKGRLATGLFFTADLAQLKAEMAAAQKAAGWTPLGDPAKGWSTGYPAAVLPKASRNGAEQRFASADGKAMLVVAVDPPMSGDAFDAFVESTSADREGRNHVDTTRVNGDLAMRYEEKGVITVAVYRNREGGLARLVFTYPADKADAYQPYDIILQRSLTVTDGLKP